MSLPHHRATGLMMTMTMAYLAGDLIKSSLTCFSTMTRRWHKYFDIAFNGCEQEYPLYAPSKIDKCTDDKKSPVSGGPGQTEER